MLLLFDIDGTLLLRASAEHAAALRHALAEVYGAHGEGRVAAAGRTDTAIARDLAALGGVGPERFDAGLEALHGRLRRRPSRAAARARCASASRPGWRSCSRSFRCARTSAARW